VAGGGEREVGSGREIELDASGSLDPDVDSDQPQACHCLCVLRGCLLISLIFLHNF
jgi:hypothetical protein